jgi:hypothetical protein
VPLISFPCTSPSLWKSIVPPWKRFISKGFIVSPGNKRFQVTDFDMIPVNEISVVFNGFSSASSILFRGFARYICLISQLPGSFPNLPGLFQSFCDVYCCKCWRYPVKSRKRDKHLCTRSNDIVSRYCSRHFNIFI